MSAAPQTDLDQRTEQEDSGLELTASLIEAQALAREQLGAVWQLHVDRVREQLEIGWHDQIEHILRERFSELSTRLIADFDQAVSTRARDLAQKSALMARTAAQRELTGQLNQTARRLEQAENREVWIRTLLEATDGFCSRAALFAYNNKTLRYEGGRGIGENGSVLEAEIPIAAAPAFQNAAESKDTVIALGTRTELSTAAFDFFGDPSAKKVYLFPLLVGQKTIGVLYAEPGDNAEAEPVDVSALELLSLLAAKSIEATEQVTLQIKPEVSSGLIRISGIDQGRARTQAATPPHDDLLHIRAQRFARTNTAQMLLYKAAQVRSGRASGDLYTALNQEIDAGRDAFRQQFLTSCPSMVDYYHQELVERLANHDISLLGSRYPGPLA